MEFFNPHLYDLSNPELWVAVGLILFFVVAWRMGAFSKVNAALDAKAAKIQSDLDEAARLRTEAQAMLEKLRAERVEAEAQAKAMLAAAEDEAKRLEVEAEQRLAESIARREALAEAEVKAAAAEQAAAAAERVLASRVAAGASDPLVDQAIGQIGTRLN